MPTPEWTKVTRRPTEESINTEHDDDGNDWSYEINDDNDFNPAPCDMFEMDHPTSPRAQITTVIRTVPPKVQPTKLIPIRMTNKFTLLTNDDADGSNENDDTDTTKEGSITELDLESLVNSNKNMPEYNEFDDEASQVTVATKNFAKKNQYAPKNHVPRGLPPKHHVPHGVQMTQRTIDFELFPETSEGRPNATQPPKYPTKPKKSHKSKNRNKNKKKSTQKQKVGKQATSRNENKSSSTSGHNGDPPEDTAMNADGPPGSNNNSNANQRGGMNEKSNQWNDERCPQQLGNDNDATNLNELQAFSINFNFRNVPKDKAGIVLKAFINECMLKDNSVVFHPTNR